MAIRLFRASAKLKPENVAILKIYIYAVFMLKIC